MTSPLLGGGVKLARALLPWIIFLAAWQILALAFPIPSALRILTIIVTKVSDPAFVSALGGSLIRMAVGYLCAAILGIGLGLLVGRFQWLDGVLGTLAAALNAMPGAAWVPLAVFLFGLTQGAVIFTIVLGATGIVMLNTYSGIQSVPPLLLRAGRTMGARGFKIFFHVILPASIPRIVDGLRLAWAFGWRALMAGELLITSIHGLGQLLNEVSRQRNIEQLLAFMMIIAIIGMAVDGLFFNRIVGDRVRARWGTA